MKKYFKNIINQNNNLKKKKLKRNKSIILNKLEKTSFTKRQSKKNIQINLFNNNLISKYYSNIIVFIIVSIIGLLVFLSFGPYFKIKNNS